MLLISVNRYLHLSTLLDNIFLGKSIAKRRISNLSLNVIVVLGWQRGSCYVLYFQVIESVMQVRDLKNSHEELKLFLDMYKRESTDPR